MPAETKTRRVAAWLFILTGLLMLVVAFMGLFKGSEVKVVFLAIGLFWLILGLVAWKKKTPG